MNLQLLREKWGGTTTHGPNPQPRQTSEKEARRKWQREHTARRLADLQQAMTRLWKLEGQRQWIPTAVAYFFTSQRCEKCGTEHTTVSGPFLKRQKKNDNRATQWFTTDEPSLIPPHIPREIHHTEGASIDLCPQCTPVLQAGQLPLFPAPGVSYSHILDARPPTIEDSTTFALCEAQNLTYPVNPPAHDNEKLPWGEI